MRVICVNMRECEYAGVWCDVGVVVRRVDYNIIIREVCNTIHKQ